MTKRMAYICSMGMDDEDEIQLWYEWRDTKLATNGSDGEPGTAPER